MKKKEMTQREMASLGGKQRAKKLSKERRVEIAMQGVEARNLNKQLKEIKKLEKGNEHEKKTSN